MSLIGSGSRHHANAEAVPGEDPTTGEGPAGWRAPSIQPDDIPPEQAQAFMAAFLAATQAINPLQRVQATEDVASAEWSPYFAVVPFTAIPIRMMGDFSTRRSLTVMNPATKIDGTANTVVVWLARSFDLLQTVMTSPALGASPVEGVMLLAPGSSIVLTHRLGMYAAVPVATGATGLLTGWYEGSARARRVPWEPIVQPSVGQGVS